MEMHTADCETDKQLHGATWLTTNTALNIHRQIIELKSRDPKQNTVIDTVKRVHGV